MPILTPRKQDAHWKRRSNTLPSFSCERLSRTIQESLFSLQVSHPLDKGLPCFNPLSRRRHHHFPPYAPRPREIRHSVRHRAARTPPRRQKTHPPPQKGHRPHRQRPCPVVRMDDAIALTLTLTLRSSSSGIQPLQHRAHRHHRRPHPPIFSLPIAPIPPNLSPNSSNDEKDRVSVVFVGDHCLRQG